MPRKEIKLSSDNYYKVPGLNLVRHPPNIEPISYFPGVSENGHLSEMGGHGVQKIFKLTFKAGILFFCFPHSDTGILIWAKF